MTARTQQNLETADVLTTKDEHVQVIPQPSSNTKVVRPKRNPSPTKAAPHKNVSNKKISRKATSDGKIPIKQLFPINSNETSGNFKKTSKSPLKLKVSASKTNSKSRRKSSSNAQTSHVAAVIVPKASKTRASKKIARPIAHNRPDMASSDISTFDTYMVLCI
ncbi:hypothetical protein BATDEDRAFT_85960 [Batrachochytrium dendrobatidis JAM81]|uniref:Uncharacterized protein n=1 Tax=Batrachochytrium dendrobatidis (strain JAM81 / FGSC 10211) TaxID=684364 RepID=F4NTI7_BATDJ|nr:uncharacterized protein BATDEDRAFT_85960 [Batrachochytrium dendrobatidis JAM81]EGF83512.1 hypothetical protein BATDEDRAFT_85960 [Batrachochytrium dendrobatidis JAM81]|eukprot:XP_006676121.1 hypothetical protein BATDEDRAFT_85960 [Batrachochytrium dendrobatidis JAM81]